MSKCSHVFRVVIQVSEIPKSAHFSISTEIPRFRDAMHSLDLGISPDLEIREAIFSTLDTCFKMAELQANTLCKNEEIQAEKVLSVIFKVMC